MVPPLSFHNPTVALVSLSGLGVSSLALRLNPTLTQPQNRPHVKLSGSRLSPPKHHASKSSSPATWDFKFLQPILYHPMSLNPNPAVARYWSLGTRHSLPLDLVTYHSPMSDKIECSLLSGAYTIPCQFLPLLRFLSGSQEEINNDFMINAQFRSYGSVRIGLVRGFRVDVIRSRHA